MPSAKAKGALGGAAAGAASGAAFGPWGAAVGGVIGGLSGYFGAQDAPNIPDPIPNDLGAAASQAISINTANFDKSSALASKTNSTAQSQANALMEQALPGFTALKSKYLSAAAGDLANENRLPPEMEQEIARVAAERGISRGTSGQFNDFSLIKDFGFNMVDYAQAMRMRSLSTLSQITGLTPKVSPMSPMAMFVTPGQAFQVQKDNNDALYQAQLARAGVNAAASNYNNSLTSGLLMTAGEFMATQAGEPASKASPKAGARKTGH